MICDTLSVPANVSSSGYTLFSLLPQSARLEHIRIAELASSISRVARVAAQLTAAPYSGSSDIPTQKSGVMGGGPDKEHMLIVLWEPEPKETIAKIKEKFPYIEVTYFQIKSYRANAVKEGVPKGQAAPFRCSVTPVVGCSNLIWSTASSSPFQSYHIDCSQHDVTIEDIVSYD